MTYTNAEKMILTAPAIGSAEAAKRLCLQLGSPEKKLKTVKVMGEAGKSSSAILLSAAISAAGYKSGRLTVPHIGSARESLCINEKPLSIEIFTGSAEKVKTAVGEIKKDDPNFTPSSHDLLLSVALCAFDACGCDFAVVEVNSSSYSAFDNPMLSVITSISSEKTAREICAKLDRQTGETVTAMQSREVYRIIFDKCAEINCRLSMPLRNSFTFMSASLKRVEFTYNTRLYSIGTGAYYQIYNVLTVIEAVEALNRLGIKIPSTEVCSAVLGQGIPLRFEMLSVMPTIIVDCADDENKRRRLIETLKMQGSFTHKKPRVICEEKQRKLHEEFSLMGLDVSLTELRLPDAKKFLRNLCSELDQDSATVIIGSSQYCEEISKIIKDLLM